MPYVQNCSLHQARPAASTNAPGQILLEPPFQRETSPSSRTFDETEGEIEAKIQTSHPSSRSFNFFSSMYVLRIPELLAADTGQAEITPRQATGPVSNASEQEPLPPDTTSEKQSETSQPPSLEVRTNQRRYDKSSIIRL